MANGFGTKPFNAPIVPDFSAGMPTVAPAGGAITPEAAPMSPIDTLKEVFFDIRDGIESLVTQSKEALGFEKEKDRETDIDQSLGRGDKDEVEKTDGKSILDSLRENLIGPLTEGFQNVSIGEKLKAALLVGALALFIKVSDSLVPVVKKIVESFQFVRDKVFGDTENPNTNTLLALLGIFAAFKLAPLVSVAKDVSTYLGGAMLKGLKSLNTAFIAMRAFIVKDMIPAIVKAYGGVKGKLFGAITKLGTAFTALRTFVTASMIPAITGMLASLTPMIAPLLPVVAIAAAVVAVLYSFKSAFETFKTSLDEGDSILVAVGKGILDFGLTLATLPLTLVKNLVGFFAGILGFDSFKEKLDNFNFKDAFIGILTGFVTKVKDFFTDVLKIDIGGIISKLGNLGAKVGNTLKAIAKGSVAMIAAAAPGGESPTEAFSRVYNEVMAAGESAADTSPVVKKDAVADEEIEKASTTMEAAKAAVTQDAAYTTDNRVFNTTNNIMQEKIVAILKAQLDLAEMKMKMDLEAQKNMMMINKGGDVVNQSSNTFQAGAANSDHTDLTAKILASNVD